MFLSRSHVETAGLAGSASTPHSKISWVASACALVLMLAALGGLSGCASGSHGLPSGLPIPNPGGLVFTTSALANGVAGRSYTYDFVFTGGTAPFTCVLQAAGPLSGASATFSATPGGGTSCQVTGMATVASSSAVSVKVTDSGTPTPQVAFSPSLTLTINPALATNASALSLANAVNGRAYTQNLSVAITGGTQLAMAGAPYTCMVVGLPFDGLASTAPAATTAACTFTINGPANAAGLMSGMPPVSDPTQVAVTATDTQLVETFPSGAVIPLAAGAAVPAGDLLVVPSGTSAAGAFANNLMVRSEFSFNTPLPAAFPDGVVGRTYGNAPLAPPPLTTNVSATVGNMPLTACGFTAGTNLMGNPLGETVAAPATCDLASTGNLSMATSPGSLSLTVTGKDSPIFDPNLLPGMMVVVVPANTIPASAAVALTIHPALTLSLDPAGVPAVNPAPAAVMGRTYGNTAAGFKDLAFDVAGGLTPYTFAAVTQLNAPGTGVPNAVACSQTAATKEECTSGASTVSASPGLYSFTITPNDTGNTATPSAMASGTQPSTPASINVNAVLALAVDVNSAAVNPAPPAVMGRSYGNTGAGFKDLAFDATGGLPAYIFGLPATINAPGTGVPNAVACTMTSATKEECTSGASTVSAGMGLYSFSITLNDTANATTPSAMTSGTQPAAIPGSITVNLPLALAPDAAGQDPPTNGVVNRTYGNVGAGFKALIYDATGGIPNAVTGYTFTQPPSVAAPAANGVPQNVACTPNAAGTVDTCTSGAAVITAAFGAYPFQIVLDDTANPTTPSGSQSGTTSNIARTITIRKQLAINAPSPNPVTPAVNGRPYGTPAGSQDLLYSLSAGEGLPTVTLMGAGFPAPITCTTVNNAADSTLTMHCNSSNMNVTGATATGTVTATDTANATTPAATTGTDPASQRMDSLTVNAALSFTVDAASVDPPPFGVVNRTYGNTMAGFKALIYDAMGGIPGATGYTITLPATVGAPAVNGVPSAVACTANGANTVVTCTGGTTPIGATAGAYPFMITFDDTANATTPSGFEHRNHSRGFQNDHHPSSIGDQPAESQPCDECRHRAAVRHAAG